MPEPTATDPVQFDYQTAQRVVRAVRTVEQMSGKQTGQRGGNAPQYAPPVILRLRNDSGADREKFQVLCINEIVGGTAQDTDEQARQIYVSGINPNTGVARHAPCVLLQDCRRNDYADVVISGPCFANVDMLDAGHNCVELVNADPTKLQSAESGPGGIIWVGSGTGEKLALINLGDGPSHLIGKTDATSSLNATVTVSVWSGTANAAGSDTGRNVTAYNRMGSVASGRYVVLARVNKGWEIISANC